MGASVVQQGVHFSVWAPRAINVAVELRTSDGIEPVTMPRGGDGIFSTTVPGVGAGARYSFRLDEGDSFPDPWSRSQPEGVHMASEVVDPATFEWRDEGWPGLRREGLVLYECHVGTFTPEGTFEGVIGQLPELANLGITALELMPVAEFPGRWNWGYDGVCLYAPSSVYGGPEGLKRLVDAAHRHGIGVILDVVYNHLGPDGNYLRSFSPHYFTDRHETPWGEAFDFDGPESHWVREYVIQNACYWIGEFHMDGLRLDATHAIVDHSPTHILAELAERVRGAADSRSVVLIAEDNANDVRLIRPAEAGGFGLDAVWADDFHHSIHVLLTGQREGYYEDFEGKAAEVARAIESGFVYQGQPSPRLGRPRGTRVTDEPACAFVFCLQNHDQVGNRPFGRRLNHLADLDRYAAASVLLMLCPETPLLFMGQEFAASSPFLYFTDHHEELGALVTEGRRREFHYMDAFRDPARHHEIPDPQDRETFFRSKLDLSERASHPGVYRLYRDLVSLRRTDPVFSAQDRSRLRVAAVGDSMLALHLRGPEGHRLVVSNFGGETAVHLGRAAGLGELPGGGWELVLSSASSRYGGDGREPDVLARDGGLYLSLPAACSGVFESPDTGGNQEGEYTWFALGASMPVISMDAERAARQIVQAAFESSITAGPPSRVQVLDRHVVSPACVLSLSRRP